VIPETEDTVFEILFPLSSLMTSSLEMPKQQSSTNLKHPTCRVACFVGHSKQISVYATKTCSSGKF